jgi:import inner membrane translocase subunit TIM50
VAIAIGVMNVADVRPIVRKYAGTHVPTEYAKVEAENKRRLVEAWEDVRRRRSTKPSMFGNWSLGALFGMEVRFFFFQHGCPRIRCWLVLGQDPYASEEPPKTPVEQGRERAQKMYLEEQKYWKDHADEFKKLMEEDKEKQMLEYVANLLFFLSLTSNRACC